MDVCQAKTQISLGIRPVWSESSLCAQWVAMDPRFLHADSKESDLTGRRLRLICFRWVHMPFCWFCCALAQLVYYSLCRDGTLQIARFPVPKLGKPFSPINQSRCFVSSVKPDEMIHNEPPYICRCLWLLILSKPGQLLYTISIYRVTCKPTFWLSIHSFLK